MRDEMKHVLTVFNQDMAIFKEALIAEGSVSALLLLDRLEKQGHGKLLLTQYDLILIYNGMSRLELNGVEQKRNDEAMVSASSRSRHAWGNDPVSRFRNWQQFILARV
jgi:hypothetical protein